MVEGVQQGPVLGETFFTTLYTHTEHSFPPSPDRETRSGVPVRPPSLSSAVSPFTGGSI